MSAWILEQQGAVVILTLSRPPRNILDIAASDELAAHLAELAKRTSEIAVVMLIDTVDGNFIAHFDIEDLTRIGRGEIPRKMVESCDRALALLEEIRQPTIAAIDGQAWDSGSELALACSLRVGLISGGGGTQRPQRLIGRAAAYDIILRARIVKADEGRRLGWLNAVLPVEYFRAAPIRYAAEITQFPVQAPFAAKRFLALAHKVPNVDLIQERELFWNLVETSETFKARAVQEEAIR